MSSSKSPVTIWKSGDNLGLKKKNTEEEGHRMVWVSTCLIYNKARSAAVFNFNAAKFN